jgi:cysteine desulfurase family protein (TIGR01976 family)
MRYDVQSVRKNFPALVNGAAHFDGPGGSQVPESVGRAVGDTLTSAIANQGSETDASRRADEVVAAARRAMADLLGADSRGIVFGRSMTQLTYDVARALAKTWTSADEVVVTRLDHDANIRPWVHAAESVGATVRWADFDPNTGEQTLDHIAEVVGSRTRLVAVTGASNLLGTRPPVVDIARLVHDAGARLYVDGVHLTPHAPVDVAALGADFFACSPYKFLGPHCGVVAGRLALLERLRPDKLLPSSNQIPERFELGTLPYELLAGTTAAVDFLAGLSHTTAGTRRERVLASMSMLEAHEDGVRRFIEEQLQELDVVRLYGHAAHRTPTLLFSIGSQDSEAVSARLAELGVNAPSGSFYALEASRRLGLGEAGALRVGVAPYTDDADVARLLDAVQRIVGKPCTQREHDGGQ